MSPEEIVADIRAKHPDYEEGFTKAIREGLEQGLFTAERLESGEWQLSLTPKGWEREN